VRNKFESDGVRILAKCVCSNGSNTYTTIATRTVRPTQVPCQFATSMFRSYVITATAPTGRVPGPPEPVRLHASTLVAAVCLSVRNGQLHKWTCLLSSWCPLVSLSVRLHVNTWWPENGRSSSSFPSHSILIICIHTSVAARGTSYGNAAAWILEWLMTRTTIAQPLNHLRLAHMAGLNSLAQVSILLDDVWEVTKSRVARRKFSIPFSLARANCDKSMSCKTSHCSSSCLSDSRCYKNANIHWRGFQICQVTTGAMYVERNTKARSRNHSYRVSECVCSLSYPACKAHAPYNIICGLSDSTTFFSHYLTNGTIFGKTITEHKLCVLILCISFVWNISHSKNSARYYHKRTQVFM
jgi:hypothetical protein